MVFSSPSRHISCLRRRSCVPSIKASLDLRRPVLPPFATLPRSQSGTGYRHPGSARPPSLPKTDRKPPSTEQMQGRSPLTGSIAHTLSSYRPPRTDCLCVKCTSAPCHTFPLPRSTRTACVPVVRDYSRLLSSFVRHALSRNRCGLHPKAIAPSGLTQDVT
ncbi:hypothetical protein BD311DRAFT_844305 [Dichomitus squalens]|uniref:Uncharacterized protein n=1 Tax=Dichomitus squalens TaxID=114155 RepID=A0A4Q9MIW8_9APHY|nr:hypothetical protein BD311DRAFT_844305 [Dichomitus squalens]